jgi:hypothetical protein
MTTSLICQFPDGAIHFFSKCSPSNYALERSVRGFYERAAGAQTIIAPAARWPRLARPAQRGR